MRLYGSGVIWFTMEIGSSLDYYCDVMEFVRTGGYWSNCPDEYIAYYNGCPLELSKLYFVCGEVQVVPGDKLDILFPGTFYTTQGTFFSISGANRTFLIDLYDRYFDIYIVAYSALFF